jgi:hypothetical protein
VERKCSGPSIAPEQSLCRLSTHAPMPRWICVSLPNAKGHGDGTAKRAHYAGQHVPARIGCHLTAWSGRADALPGRSACGRSDHV